MVAVHSDGQRGENIMLKVYELIKVIRMIKIGIVIAGKFETLIWNVILMKLNGIKSEMFIVYAL